MCFYKNKIPSKSVIIKPANLWRPFVSFAEMISKMYICVLLFFLFFIYYHHHHHYSYFVPIILKALFFASFSYIIYGGQFLSYHVMIKKKIVSRYLFQIVRGILLDTTLTKSRLMSTNPDDEAILQKLISNLSKSYVVWKRKLSHINKSSLYFDCV